MEIGSASSPFERMQSTSNQKQSIWAAQVTWSYVPKIAALVPKDLHDKAGHDKSNIVNN